MSVPYQFPSDIEQGVRAQIQTGRFKTEDDVLREAIDTLEKRGSYFVRLASVLSAVPQNLTFFAHLHLDLSAHRMRNSAFQSPYSGRTP